MRLTVLGLALAFLTAQSVAWADCCCGTLCQHKNECTGCGPEDVCPGSVGSTSSCCDEDDSEPVKTCSHQEPSSEIDSVPSDAASMSTAPLEPLLVANLPLAAPPMEEFQEPVDTGPPRAAPLPRHLSLRVLRI